VSARLPVFPAAELPLLAYAHDGKQDIAALPWRPIAEHGWVKPHGGTGLWTAPVTSQREDGSPADTSWLEWCRSEMSTDGYTHLTEVDPHDTARVLRIDSQADLIAIVDAYPSTSQFFSTALDHRYPHWVDVAEDGWEAVFLTDQGQWETRLPPRGPNLYGRDCTSVLWLRPAFTVGVTTAVPAAALGGAQ
jgi:hypothetical protein